MSNLLIPVPETALPNGLIVPAFYVGQYGCTKGTDGKAAITAEGTPWVKINFAEAQAACAAIGLQLITETQWLAIAWDVSRQDINWTGGTVGEGKLYQGLHKWTANAAQPGTHESTDPEERRWLQLSNGERIHDFAGNAYSWVHDDVHGDENGLIARRFEDDDISLQAPFPSMKKGMGWRPDSGADWSGRALIRGGYWYSESNAGAFNLRYDWPVNRYDLVGFRCTQPIGL